MTELRIALIAVALSTAVAAAHHSFAAEYDANNQIAIVGTITKVEWTNPHTWFFIDVKNPDGSVTNWGLELAGPTNLLRAGWKRDAMKVGDPVTVDAFRARDDSHKANAKSILHAVTRKPIFTGTPEGR